LFGLRRNGGNGLFGVHGNCRPRRLRRLIFLMDFDLAAQNRAVFDDEATRPRYLQ
jgi:hypothetical protein